MTITLTREEAQSVLDVIERNIVGVPRYRATELLRARLSAPAPEPVAWNCAADLADASICKSWCGNSNCISHIAPSKPESEYESQPEPEPVMLMDAPLLLNGQPLYTASPQREWQSLTDEERNDCLVEADPCEALLNHEAWELMRTIEAKLKEKNT